MSVPFLRPALARLPSFPSTTTAPVQHVVSVRFKYNPGKLRQKKANAIRRKKESERIAEMQNLRAAVENLEKGERTPPGPPPAFFPRLGPGTIKKMPPELRLEYEDLREFGPVPENNYALEDGSDKASGSGTSSKPKEISFLADSILHVAASPSPVVRKGQLDPQAVKSLLSLKVAFADLESAAAPAAAFDEVVIDDDTLEELGIDLSKAGRKDRRSPSRQRRPRTNQTNLEDDDESSPPSLASVNKVIYANALVGRPEAAHAAFALLGDLALSPDVRSYNGIMLAHVRAKDLRGAVAAFRALEESGIQPDQYSFGILIKGCVDASQLPSAYGLYEQLKLRGLTPTLPIFTTLIAGCIDANHLARAWKTFDHARGVLNIVPDRDLYTTMMSCAGREGNAERALDLHVEMQERGITPSAVTYNALISTCARRADHRVPAFQLFAQMLAEEMAPTVTTYDALMTACANAGDLLGARDLWNVAVGTGVGKVEVDARLLASFMKVYVYALGDWFQHLRNEGATATKKQRRFMRSVGKSSFISGDSEDSTATTTTTTAPSSSHHLEQPVHRVLPFGEWLERRRLASKADVGDEGSKQPELALNGEIPEHKRRPYFHDISIPYDVAIEPVRRAEAWDPERGEQAPPVYEPPESVPPAAVFLTFAEDCEDTALAFPMLQYELKSEDDLIAEARALFNWIVRRNGRLLQVPEQERKGDLPLTEWLMNQYLNLHMRHPILALSVVETMDLLETLLPKGDWDARSRMEVAIHVTNDPRLMAKYGKRVFESLEAWDAAKEAQLASLGLSPFERERRREKEGRGKAAWTHAFVSLANGRARLGDIRGAMVAIEDLHNFRQPFYLPPPDPRHLTPVFNVCRDAAEDGDPEPLRKLKRMVPEPAESPLEEVQRILRKRWVGSQWWGWEAMGVGQKRVREWESKVKRELREIRTRGLGPGGGMAEAVMKIRGGAREQKLP